MCSPATSSHLQPSRSNYLPHNSTASCTILPNPGPDTPPQVIPCSEALGPLKPSVWPNLFLQVCLTAGLQPTPEHSLCNRPPLPAAITTENRMLPPTVHSAGLGSCPWLPSSRQPVVRARHTAGSRTILRLEVIHPCSAAPREIPSLSGPQSAHLSQSSPQGGSLGSPASQQTG